MYCPRSTHQNDQQEICLAIACLGGALALGAGLIGLVWTACSSYPRWGYAVIIVLLFSVGMVFVGF